ncbi:hypothetical protein J1614_003252 [Plenodomus biglobosus]|nr:hypothetical protein J1614_003252 [Plenodomus biglobosus]
MKLPGICLLLLMSLGLCDAGRRGLSLSPSDDPLLMILGAVPAVAISNKGHEGLSPVNPRNNYGGWVNPEDLPSMPQCIAKQDPSAWLEAMTRCISRGCTKHFGVICTHHQWLARLDCLKTAFDGDLVGRYFPLCSRSILAKAQLYSWIETITGRTWLVEPEDSTELHNISPHSLVRGYMDHEVINKAPSCLRASSSFPTAEGFQHVTSWCSFTGVTQHTGNAARPWEYNEGLRSMVALDFETAGYDLTHHKIPYGEYIDKECLCTSYTINVEEEPCRDPAQALDLTRERLWMMATCGLLSIPHSWTQNLTTIGEDFILIEDWPWPAVIPYIQQRTESLVKKCTTDACEIDRDGYCTTMRGVERACFCRDMSYDMCGKPCQDFEIRIYYVNWLYQVCGAVPAWHGLPEDWKQLALPSPLETIPWNWPIVQQEDPKSFLYSTLMLVNFISIILSFDGHIIGSRRVSKCLPLLSMPQHWFFRGILIVGYQILASWITALILSDSSGYEETPILQMILLWCSMPRLAWLPLLLIGFQPFEEVNLPAAASALWAEIILQALSSYHLLMTVAYGFKHNFYFGRLAEVEKTGFAQLVYYGALMWLVVVGLILLQLTRMDKAFLRRWHIINWSSTEYDGGQLRRLHERCAWIDEEFAYYWMGRFRAIDLPILEVSDGSHQVGYGSMSSVSRHHTIRAGGTRSLYALATIGTFFLFVSQMLFWFGFLGIMSVVNDPIGHA